MNQLLAESGEKQWTFTKAKSLLSRPYDSGVMNLQEFKFCVDIPEIKYPEMVL